MEQKAEQAPGAPEPPPAAIPPETRPVACRCENGRWSVSEASCRPGSIDRTTTCLVCGATRLDVAGEPPGAGPGPDPLAVAGREEVETATPPMELSPVPLHTLPAPRIHSAD